MAKAKTARRAAPRVQARGQALRSTADSAETTVLRIEPPPPGRAAAKTTVHVAVAQVGRSILSYAVVDEPGEVARLGLAPGVRVRVIRDPAGYPRIAEVLT